MYAEAAAVPAGEGGCQKRWAPRTATAATSLDDDDNDGCVADATVARPVSNAMKGVTPEVRVKVCKAIVQKLGLQRGFALLGRLPVEEESKLPCIGSFLPGAHSDEDAATLQTEVYHQWLDDLPTAKDIATLEEIITHLPQALDVPKVLWDQC